MPPKRIYLPDTLAQFADMAEREKEKYLPLVRNLQLHELEGLRKALEVAFTEIRTEVRAEDIRRGARPPGTTIGR